MLAPSPPVHSPALRILREAAAWTQTAAEVELEDLLGVTRAENHADGAQRPDWSRLDLLPLHRELLNEG